MKTKTSVTLSSDLAQAIDKLAGKNESRSALIERALREFVSRQQQLARDAHDLKVINRNAKRLNREAEDVLGYQEVP